MLNKLKVIHKSVNLISVLLSLLLYRAFRSHLTFWSRNYFVLILAHPVYQMLINTGTKYVRIMKHTASRRERNGGCTLSVALVRTRTIPTERPPPFGEVSANFCG